MTQLFADRLIALFLPDGSNSSVSSLGHSMVSEKEQEISFGHF